MELRESEYPLTLYGRQRHLPDIETEESTTDGAKSGEDCLHKYTDNKAQGTHSSRTVNIRNPIHSDSSRPAR